MTTWIWIAIIALVIYMMFRRKKTKDGTGTIEPQEAPREEKVIEAEDIPPQPQHAEVTAEHSEAPAEENDETKAA